MIGRATGEMHRLGDSVEVKLIEAAPLAGALRFELLTEGRVLARKDRPQGEPRRSPEGRPAKKDGQAAIALAAGELTFSFHDICCVKRKGSRDGRPAWTFLTRGASVAFSVSKWGMPNVEPARSPH